jgi:hypothetical protein
MVRRHWLEEWRTQPLVKCPGEAKVVTGDPQKDAYLHYLITEFGVELKFEPARSTDNIKEYIIHDEQKFAWFVLRWT